MNQKIDNIIIHDENNIKGFFYDYRWLSNFHLCRIVYNNLEFNSIENAYQSAKSLHVPDQIKFVNISPDKAKYLGRRIKIREDWEDVKLKIMYQLNLQKYSFNPELKTLLLNTGNKYLEETNYWNDTFWGVYNNKGENNLGKIIMKIRQHLI